MSELALLANSEEAVLIWAVEVGLRDAEGNFAPGVNFDPLPRPLMVKEAEYDVDGNVTAPPVLDPENDYYSNLLLTGQAGADDVNPDPVDEDGFDQSLLRVWFRDNGVLMPRESKNPDYSKVAGYYKVTYPAAFKSKAVGDNEIELIWPAPAARKRVWAA